MPDDHELARELAAWRADTIGVAGAIHLDNAGSSLPPAPVTDAVIAHLRREAEVGGYRAEDEQRARLDDTYAACAALVGAQPDEIALVESATTGWQMAFHSIAFTDGDRILTGVSEYASNFLGYLRLARDRRIVIDVVPDDAHGQIDVDRAAAMMTDRTRLIAITHVPTNGGLVNPAAAVGRLARARGITYLLDACQSVGQMPIDVDDIGCDYLSFTGRKFVRGPRGTGALYARRAEGGIDPALIDLHSAEWVDRDAYRVRHDARRFENYERNIAAHIGLGVAARYALAVGPDRAWHRIERLAARLRTGLADIDGVSVHDKGRTRCGIVTFAVEGTDAPMVMQRLREHGVTVNVTWRASTLLDMVQRELDALARASVHYFNTDEEIDRTIELVAAIAHGSH
jgi:selenocysteine lyase/cysteine desulfurase